MHNALRHARWRSLVLLSLPFLYMATSHAEPAPGDLDIEAKEKQCMQAETPEQCRPALLICMQLEAAKQKELQSRERDLALAKIWNKFMECKGELGQDAAAEQHGRQALALRQKLLGPEHSDIAESLSNLAWVLDRQGKYGEAESLHRQALVMRQKLLGSEHADIPRSLNNLGLVLTRLGKYGEAESLHRQALALNQKLLGQGHSEIAVSIESLANVLLRQGKYAEAEPLHRQALALEREQFGPEHADVARAMNSLAGVLNRQGKYVEAESLHRQALAMRQKVLGPEHREVADSINNLSFVLESQGKYGEMELLHRQALAMRQKFLGPEHPDTVASMHNLAVVLSRQGKDSEAETLLRQTLALWLKLLSPEHPNVAASYTHLGQCLLRQGRLAAALDPLYQAAHIRESQLRATVSETRMQAIIQWLRNDEDVVYGLALSAGAQPGGRKLALLQTLLRKGRTTEAGTLANRLLHQQLNHPDVQKRFDQWQAVRQQREALLYGEVGKLKPAEYQARLKDLQLQAESLEAQLAQSLPQIQSLQPPAFDDIVPEVARHIPKDGVLVEVIWMRPEQAQAQSQAARWGAPRFVALLLFPDQRSAAVDLGEVAVVDKLGRELLAVLRNPGSDPKPEAQAIYQKILAPLLPHLGDKRNLLLSLDGSLNLIPFDALHDGTDYLLGRYHFHYLTSGRDLLRQPSQRTPGPPLILANPDFGKPEPVVQGQSLSIYQRIAGLPPLPAAQPEAVQIASMVGATPLLAANAREEVVHTTHAPWFLHFATHGLFLSDIDLPARPDDRASLILGAPKRPLPSGAAPEQEKLPGEDGAMNRSALALANVLQGHRAASSQSDGLLTAQEVRSLDLDGTQLVVLSACETGQGTLSAGQGVYGLRRAFLVAGAETLVSSLWRVHDEATGTLMTMYYRKLLDRLSPGDRLGAMVEAMQELRRRPNRSHPYYWAPFLVIGQSGPLSPPAALQP